MEEKFSFYELSLIATCLDFNLYDRFKAHEKFMKVIPDMLPKIIQIYHVRHDTWEKLVKDGYAQIVGTNTTSKYTPFKIYYQVNNEGEKKFRREISEMLVYKKPSERDLEYLKNRIVLYCKICNYNFGSDNAGYVFENYVNGYLQNIYMSHTVKDCVNEFLKEMKKHKKELIKLYKKHDKKSI